MKEGEQKKIIKKSAGTFVLSFTKRVRDTHPDTSIQKKKCQTRGCSITKPIIRTDGPEGYVLFLSTTDKKARASGCFLFFVFFQFVNFTLRRAYRALGVS